jgi:hypothetical protein
MKPFSCFVLLLLLICCSDIQAQNAAEDFKKINKNLSKRRYSMQVTYRMYDTYENTSPFETKNMRVNLWDGEIKISSDRFEAIRNKSLYLYINYSNKMVMLNPVNSKSIVKTMNEMEKWFNVDTVMKYYDKIETKESNANTRTYRIYPKKMAILQYAYTDIQIDVKKQVINKMVIYYAHTLNDMLSWRKQEDNKDNKLPRMEIVFSDYDFTSKYNEQLFSLNRFIKTNDKGKHDLIAPYNQYEFFDNTNRK